MAEKPDTCTHTRHPDNLHCLCGERTCCWCGEYIKMLIQLIENRDNTNIRLILTNNDPDVWQLRLIAYRWDEGRRDEVCINLTNSQATDLRRALPRYEKINARHRLPDAHVPPRDGQQADTDVNLDQR